MKHTLHLFVLLQLSSISLFSQTLDNTFSGDGKATIQPGLGGVGMAVAITPDKKIVVAGSGDQPIHNTNFAVSRFNSDGTIDGTFGSGGTAIIALGLQTLGAAAVAVQADGKIVVTGTVFPVGDQRAAGVVRLTKDGVLDGTFGNGGVLSLNVPTNGRAIAVQQDGNILVAGEYGGQNAVFSVVRLLGTNGSPDPSFGSGGQVLTPVDGGWGGEVRAMTLDAAGEIFVTGTGNSSIHLVTVKYSKKGVLVDGFGTHGVSLVNVSGTDQVFGGGITLEADGFILLAGSYDPAGSENPKCLVVRLRGDGTLDPSFAGNGKLGITVPGFDNARAVGIVEDISGRLVVAGYTWSTGVPDKFVLTRLLITDGSIDYAWGTNGQVTTGWSGANALAYGCLIQPDGRIVVAGAENGNFAVARYNDPITIPRPPVITSTNLAAVSSGAGTMNFAGVRIFPNPASSELQVQGLDPATPTLVMVKDASGRAVMTVKAMGQSTWPLDIHRLPVGAYFLELSTTGDHKSFQFLKSN